MLSLVVAFAMAADPGTLYVSPAGNDGWNGRSADTAFATLGRACAEIRRQKKSGLPAGGITVLVRAGTYCLPETLTLGPDESGTAEAPIVFRACDGEKPVVMGARPIGNFTAHEGAILKADVAAQGFKGIAFRQLVFAGRRQPVARYPNFDPENPYGGGWTYVAGEEKPMYADVPGEDRRTVRYKPEDDRAWSRPEEAEVFIFPRYNWWNNIVRVARIDRASRTITLAGDCSYPPRPGDRYYVQNVREELDAPGEWYLDAQGATLYFWPPEPLSGRPMRPCCARSSSSTRPSTSRSAAWSSRVAPERPWR